MPIFDVELVCPRSEALPDDLAHRLADALGSALGLPPGRAWVRCHRLEAAHYAESGIASDNTPRPVFVTVLHAHPPEGEARARECLLLTEAVAATLDRARDQVHLAYAPAGAGRLAFGGRLVP